MTSVSDLRQRIHEKSHEYPVFDSVRREGRDHNKFYGATDTLVAVSDALAQFDVMKRKPTLLECYGFLQVLYVAQDAVQILSESVGLGDWKYGEATSCLMRVRDLRNRICGHPAHSSKTSKEYEISSSFIDRESISAYGFSAVIYYEKRWEEVEINFQKLSRQNEKGLYDQMIQIEGQMDSMHAQFLTEMRGDEKISKFLDGYSYALSKLSFDPVNDCEGVRPKTSAPRLKSYMGDLIGVFCKIQTRKDLIDRAKEIIAGVDWYMRLLEKYESRPETLYKLNLVYDGLAKGIDSLVDEVRSLRGDRS
jgi:hypothetical protein